MDVNMQPFSEFVRDNYIVVDENNKFCKIIIYNTICELHDYDDNHLHFNISAQSIDYTIMINIINEIIRIAKIFNFSKISFSEIPCFIFHDDIKFDYIILHILSSGSSPWNKYNFYSIDHITNQYTYKSTLNTSFYNFIGQYFDIQQILTEFQSVFPHYNIFTTTKNIMKLFRQHIDNNNYTEQQFQFIAHIINKCEKIIQRYPLFTRYFINNDKLNINLIKHKTKLLFGGTIIVGLVTSDPVEIYCKIKCNDNDCGIAYSFKCDNSNHEYMELDFVKKCDRRKLSGNQCVLNMIEIARLFNIKKIILVDQSQLNIYEKYLDLASMNILANGLSWYNKFGFLSIDHDENYNHNINIINCSFIDMLVCSCDDLDIVELFRHHFNYYDVNSPTYQIMSDIKQQLQSNMLSFEQLLIVVMVINHLKQNIKYNNILTLHLSLKRKCD